LKVKKNIIPKGTKETKNKDKNINLLNCPLSIKYRKRENKYLNYKNWGIELCPNYTVKF